MSAPAVDSSSDGTPHSRSPAATAKSPVYRPPQSPARIAISTGQHSAASTTNSPSVTPRRHNQHSHSRKGSSSGSDMAGGWRYAEEKQHSPQPTHKPALQLDPAQYVPMLEQQLREQPSASSSNAIAALLSSLHNILSNQKTATGSTSAAASPLPASFDMPALLSCLHRLLTRGISLTLYNQHVNTAVSPTASPTVTSASSSRPPPGFERWKSKPAMSAAHSLSPFAMPPLLPLSSAAPSTPLAPSGLNLLPRHSPTSASASSAATTLGDEQIRLASLSNVQLLASQHPRAFQPHATLFLPSDFSSSLSPRPFAGSHLLTLVLFDSSAAVRAAAVGALASVVAGSWSLTKRTGGGSSSAAVRQLDVLRGLHVGLLDAMQREQTPTCLLALLKATGEIAAAVPYEQLLTSPAVASSASSAATQPLLTPLVDHMLKLLPPPASHCAPRSVPSSPSPTMRSLSSPHSHSSELRSTIFVALASLLDHHLPELDLYLSAPSSAQSLIPSLLSHAADRSTSDSNADAFLPLSKLARHYPSILALYWQFNSGPSLHDVLLTAPTRSIDSVGRLNALRLLEEWTKTDASQLSDEADEADEAGGGVREPLNSALFQLPGVLDLYGQQLPQLFHDRASGSQSAVRARVVTLLSFVPYGSWTSLSSTYRLQLIACMREAAGDDASAVRTASCRCLSLYALYCARQQSSETSGFVSEAVQLLLEMMGDDEKVLAVRARAAWSVANLCEISAAPPFVQHMPASSLLTLISSITAACSMGNDKVITHAIRAAGNVGRWLPLSVSGSEQQWRELVAATVSVLQGSKAAKSRWNACHAMGNLLRNPQLATRPDCVLEPYTAATLLPALLDVLSRHLFSVPAASSASSSASSNNYKVSINAAGALCAPPTRTAYGSSYAVCLRQLLSYTEQCERLDCKDYREVKYRDVLRGQLTLALLHVLSLLTERADEEAEVVAVVEGMAGAIARLVLTERMRLESEVNRARLSSVTRRATSAVFSTTAVAVASAATGVSSTVPHAEASLVEAVAERVSAILTEGARRQFVMEADGRTE